MLTTRSLIQFGGVCSVRGVIAVRQVACKLAVQVTLYSLSWDTQVSIIQMD